MINSITNSLVAFFLLNHLSHAQSRDPVSVGYRENFRSDIGNSGSVSSNRWDFNTGLPLKKTDSLFIALAASYTRAEYDFEGTIDPWDGFQRFGITVPIIKDFENNWKWSSILTVASSKEDGADFNDSINYGAISSLTYQVNENLSIGPGIAYFSRLEDSASIFPILSIKWKISDNWSLATGPSEGADSGANAHLKYTGLNHWHFLLGAYHQNTRFRLSQTSTSAPNGVGRDRISAVYGVAKYFATDSISISVVGGYSLSNKFELLDQNGSELLSESSNNAPFVGVRVSYSF